MDRCIVHCAPPVPVGTPQWHERRGGHERLDRLDQRHGQDRDQSRGPCGRAFVALASFVAAIVVAVVVSGCASRPPSWRLVSSPGSSAAAASSSSVPIVADPIISQLARGGFVLYMRHGKTEQAFQDQTSKPEWWKSCDPRSSRPLSDEGRQQMLAIGAQIRELDIPIGQVLTSEYCRAFDSGLLLQLMPVVRDQRLNMQDAQRAAGRLDDKIRHDMVTLLTTPPPEGTNVVLIGHVQTFTPAIDPVLQQLIEGETAVIRPGQGDELEVVGRIRVERWSEQAH